MAHCASVGSNTPATTKTCNFLSFLYFLGGAEGGRAEEPCFNHVRYPTPSQHQSYPAGLQVLRLLGGAPGENNCFEVSAFSQYHNWLARDAVFSLNWPKD